MARRLTAVAGGAGVLLAAVVLAVPAAYAATGSPPVTVPDTVTMRAGEGTVIDVTANDSDPDGQQLEVCRVGPTPRAVDAGVQDGQLVVLPGRRAHGTYTLTYYACDDSYLTAGTLTVKVRPPAPTLEIVPVGDGPPGPVRLVNSYKKRAFHCHWQPLNSDRIEGRTVVKPLSTVVIRVREAEFSLDCDSPGVSISAVFTVGGLSTVARPRP